MKKIIIAITLDVLMISLIIVSVLYYSFLYFDRKEVVATSFPAMFINLHDEDGDVINLKNVTKELYVPSEIKITNTKEKYCLDWTEASFKARGNASMLEAKKRV